MIYAWVKFHSVFQPVFYTCYVYYKFHFQQKINELFLCLVQTTQRAINMGETRVIKSVVMVIQANSTVQNIGVPRYNGAAMLITG